MCCNAFASRAQSTNGTERMFVKVYIFTLEQKFRAGMCVWEWKYRVSQHVNIRLYTHWSIKSPKVKKRGLWNFCNTIYIRGFRIRKNTVKRTLYITPHHVGPTLHTLCAVKKSWYGKHLSNQHSTVADILYKTTTITKIHICL